MRYVPTAIEGDATALSPSDTPDPAAPIPAAPRRRRGPGRVLLVLGGVLLAVALLLLALYAARREAAREVLVGWLERQGVEAEVEFERFDLDGLVGRIRAGPEDDPDLVVGRVEVDYDLNGPWGLPGWGVTPTRIRLYRPVVKARLHEGRLDFGSLDPIVQDFLRRPPQPDQPGPVVEIEEAQVRLLTAVGVLRARGDARLDDGRLLSLDATLPAARLRDEGLAIDLDGGRVRARTTGDRMAIELDGDLALWRGPGLELTGGAGRLQAVIPYPDEDARREGGPVSARATLQAADLRLEEVRAREGRASFDFQGRAVGWLETFSLYGQGRLDAAAGGLSAGGLDAASVAGEVDARAFQVRRGSTGLTWRVDGAAVARAARFDPGDLTARGLRLDFGRLTAGAGEGGFEAVSRVGLAADRIASGDLVLGDAAGRFALDARHAGSTLVALDGGLSARRAAWNALGPARPDDVPEFAAVKRALGDFRLDAPGLAIRTGSTGTVVALTQPARAAPAEGGVVTVVARHGRPLYAAQAGRDGGGAFDLTATGGALPEARVAVPVWRRSGAAITAELDGQAAFDFGLARDATLDAAGLLRVAGGTTTFVARECAAFAARTLELGENDIVDVSADLCGGRGPLLTIADGWRLEAAARDVSAVAPFLGMRFTGAAGPLTAWDRGRGLEATARVERGQVFDTNAPPRFRPMSASGTVGLANDDWRGRFRLVDGAGGHRVADLELDHAGRTGTGELRIDARGVRFEPEGLQPEHITPLADRVATSDTVGEADFTGAFRWTPEGATSDGRFATGGLDFVSPAGAVTRLAGEVEFTSLAPLTTAPDQTLRVAQIDAFLPLTEATVTFQLAGDAVRIASGDVRAAGGVLRIEPIEVPLDPDQAYEGVLVLEEVQLGELIARTGFADSVQLDARVSGRLPFVAGPNGVTFIEGQLAAVEPGRISIAREALVGLEAEGGGDEVPPGMVEDFAYQAMENLAFEELTATLNSLPEGRLGVLFHMRGRHDPPQRQEIRLTLGELIGRQFMNRQLPLPSGTEIDLTLDTTFNLDQLVGDLLEINRARQGRSGAVQRERR